jgi:hypothetical protein
MTTGYIDAEDPGNSSYFRYALIGKAQFGRKWVRRKYFSHIRNTYQKHGNAERKHDFDSNIDTLTEV